MFLNDEPIFLNQTLNIKILNAKSKQHPHIYGIYNPEFIMSKFV